MLILETHIVPKIASKVRLSDYAAGIFIMIPSRKGMKKAIDKKQVVVDGEIATTAHWVEEGQTIQLIDNSKSAPKAYEMDLEIVFEDEFIAIVNKPAGIAVSGNEFRTIQNVLIGNVEKSKEEDALQWPKPVHRLDRATSGLLIVAKTYKAMLRLGEMFQNKEIQKTYVAMVIGEPKRNGVVDSEINNQKAHTEYELMSSVPSLRNNKISLLKVSPRTGRTHQIRIHLSELGFPIFGDQKYGKKGEIYIGKGLFLAAVELAFKHPVTGELIEIKIPIPHKFESLLKREERRYKAKFP